MFKTARKIIRRLFLTSAILLVIAVVGILLAAPKLLVNVGGILLVLGVLCMILRGFPDWIDRQLGPSERQLQQRDNQRWF